MSNELDKQFAEQLGQYASEVDAEALWAAVQPPPKRQRTAWWWWPTGLLLAGLVGLGYGWWANQPSVSSFPVSTATQVEMTTSPAADWNSTPVANNEISTLASATAIEAEQQLDASSATNTPVQREVTNALPTTSAQWTATTETTTVATPDELLTGVQNTASTTEINENVSTVKNEPLEPISPLTAGRSTTRDIAYLMNQPQLLPERNWLVLPEGTQPLITSTKAATTPPPTADSEWSVGVSAAYMAIAETRSVTLASNEDWLQARNRTERPLDAWTVDLSMGRQLNERWSLQTGVGYTQFNSVFEQQETSRLVDTVEGVQAIIYRADNTVDTVIGEVAQITTQTRDMRIHNSIRQWEVPVLVNYHVPLNERWSVQLQAGVRVQVNRSWEGRLLLKDGEVFSVTDYSRQMWYKTGLGLSTQLGAGLNYHLGQHWQVQLGGTAQYAPRNFTLADAPFRERFQLFGAKLGLRYTW